MRLPALPLQVLQVHVYGSVYRKAVKSSAVRQPLPKDKNPGMHEGDGAVLSDETNCTGQSGFVFVFF